MISEQETIFLKYFLRTYIPRFTQSFPKKMTSEQFEEMLLSTYDPWEAMQQKLPSLMISERLKELLVALFTHVDQLYEDMLVSKSRRTSFLSWVSLDSVQASWREIHQLGLHVQKLSQQYI